MKYFVTSTNFIATGRLKWHFSARHFYFISKSLKLPFLPVCSNCEFFLCIFNLRSPSPGKLINYTIEDGGHVFEGEAYAEIEVMKMIMPLVSSCSGW